MEVTKEILDYFKGDELAAKVFVQKYMQKGDITPDDMHRRMAKEFARIEHQYILKYRRAGFSDLSEYGRKLEEIYDELSENELIERYYQLFKDFKQIIPQGSIMSQLGNDSIGSLSNCFVLGKPVDSYGGIFKIDEEIAQLEKRRGGVGIDLSGLRPEGVPTSNAAKTSTGAVSFMHRFSNTTREVAQNGRRGK